MSTCFLNNALLTPNKIGLMQVPNNYETDLIYPIIARAAELANVDYQTADDQVKTYLKVCTPFLDGFVAQACAQYLQENSMFSTFNMLLMLLRDILLLRCMHVRIIVSKQAIGNTNVCSQFTL